MSEKDKDIGQYHIEDGCKSPYDDRPPVDEAGMVALGVLHNLGGRRGIGSALESVDPSVREEIVDDVTAIIRYGNAMPVEFVKRFVIDDTPADDEGEVIGILVLTQK